jgi:cold shock CspA family protein
MCAIDSANGFILVSNGTSHSYVHYEQNQEAQRTLDLQPGDVVLFSWYSWTFSGGVPVITDPEWAGWVAGDHTGIVATAPAADGYFSAVEGNTSQSSWDNGGAVLYRTDRHISQVCGWWRPLAYGETGTTPPPEPTYNLTGLGMFLVSNVQRGIWLMGPGYAKGLSPEEYSQAAAIPGIGTFDCGDNERAFDLLYMMCLEGVTAVET